MSMSKKIIMSVCSLIIVGSCSTNENSKQMKNYDNPKKSRDHHNQIRKYIERPIDNSIINQLIDSFKPKKVLCLNKELNKIKFSLIFHQKDKNKEILVFYPSIFINQAIQYISQNNIEKELVKLFPIKEKQKFLKLASKTSNGFAGKKGHWEDDIIYNTYEEANKEYPYPDYKDQLDYYYNTENDYYMLPRSRVEKAMEEVPDQSSSYGSDYACGPNSALRAFYLLGKEYYIDYYTFVSDCPKSSRNISAAGDMAKQAGGFLAKAGLIIGNPLAYIFSEDYRGACNNIEGEILSINTTIGPEPEALAKYINKKLETGYAGHANYDYQGGYENSIVDSIYSKNCPTIILLSSSIMSMHYMNIIGYKKDEKGIVRRFVVLDVSGEIGDIKHSNLRYYLDGYAIAGLKGYNLISFLDIDADCKANDYEYTKACTTSIIRIDYNHAVLKHDVSDKAILDTKWLLARYKIDIDKKWSLARYGIVIDERNGFENSTNLIIAALLGRIEFVKFLCENGANKDLRNKYGLRAIDAAYVEGQEEIVMYLAKEYYNQRVLPSLISEYNHEWYKFPKEKLDWDDEEFNLLIKAVQGADSDFKEMYHDYKIGTFVTMELIKEAIKKDDLEKLKFLDSNLKEKEIEEKEIEKEEEKIKKLKKIYLMNNLLIPNESVSKYMFNESIINDRFSNRFNSNNHLMNNLPIPNESISKYMFNESIINNRFNFNIYNRNLFSNYINPTRNIKYQNLNSNIEFNNLKNISFEEKSDEYSNIEFSNIKNISFEEKSDEYSYDEQKILDSIKKRYTDKKIIDKAYKLNNKDIVLWLMKKYNLKVSNKLLTDIGEKYWYTYETEKEIKEEKEKEEKEKEEKEKEEKRQRKLRLKKQRENEQGITKKFVKYLYSFWG